MASKTITQLTALDTVSTNLANTLFVVYDTETGTTKKASLSQIDVAVERSIQNVTSAGIYANAAFASANSASSYANGAFASANSASSYANSASSYANAAFASANTADQKAVSAGSYANGAFAAANTKLSSSGGTITGPISGLGNSKLDFTTYGSNTAYLTTTNDDSTALFIGATSADLYANTSVTIRANTKGTSQNWTFGEDGSLTLPASGIISGLKDVNITGNLAVTSNITTSNLTVTGVFSVDGVVLQWHTPIPLTSKGDPGDKAGYIAIDNNKLYRCVENYTNGANNIWVFVNFTGGTWG